MASPQLENGYTRISNELLKAIVPAKLNGTQYSIVLALIRSTYGYHQTSRDLGVSFFHKVTGRNRRQIAKELQELIDMKIIIVEQQHTYGQCRVLKLNKDYDSWDFTKKGMLQKQHRGMLQMTHSPMLQKTH